MMDHLSLVPYDGGAGGGEAGGKYKECMRNHAAAMGGQAFDGCGEYMASSPDSLKCAACGCHRSFHRRATGTAAALAGSSCAPPVFFRTPHHLTPPLALPAPPSPQQHHFHNHHQAAAAALQALFPSSVPVPAPPHLALPYHAVPNAAVAAPPPWLDTRAGSETPPRTDDFGIDVGVGFMPGSVGGSGGSGSGSFGRKRFRTKFTPEQKERMREFAEKQGLRIPVERRRRPGPLLRRDRGHAPGAQGVDAQPQEPARLHLRRSRSRSRGHRHARTCTSSSLLHRWPGAHAAAGWWQRWGGCVAQRKRRIASPRETSCRRLPSPCPVPAAHVFVSGCAVCARRGMMDG